MNRELTGGHLKCHGGCTRVCNSPERVHQQMLQDRAEGGEGAPGQGLGGGEGILGQSGEGRGGGKAALGKGGERAGGQRVTEQLKV